MKAVDGALWERLVVACESVVGTHEVPELDEWVLTLARIRPTRASRRVLCDGSGRASSRRELRAPGTGTKSATPV